MPTPGSPPFGMPAAEFEPRLTRTYLSDLGDRRHELALAPYHCIILGRRGSGKTALAGHLEFQQDQPYDAFVTINQYRLFRRILTEVEGAMERGRAALAEDIIGLWTIGFWTAVLAELQRTKGLDSPAVRQYLSVAQPKAINASGALLDPLASIVRQRGATLLDQDALRAILDETAFEEAVVDAKACLDRLKRVAIAVDSLEEAPVQSQAMIAVAGALLLASMRSGVSMHPNIHVKCLVPTELWLYLAAKVPGVGKFTPFEIRWSVDDLIRLVGLRYNDFLAEFDRSKAVLPGPNPTSVIDVRFKVWDQFFPKRAEGPSGFLEDVVTLMMRHTQLRPRQLIQLCNMIASKSRARSFNPNHIKAGIQECLEELTNEVFAAYSRIYKDADVALQRYLRNRPAAFVPRSGDAPDEFWDMAYQMAVIGPVTGKQSLAARDESEFQHYLNAKFDFGGTATARWRPQDGELVAIHPMFHKRLGIREDANTMIGLSVLK
jgi:hypothetical protein